LGLEASPHKTLSKALHKDHYQAVAFGIRNLDNCWAFAPRLYFDEVRLLAETVRASFKGALILGGTGFSVAPQGWMQRLQADCGVVGEGERAFVAPWMGLRGSSPRTRTAAPSASSLRPSSRS
jgi:hypothetical protein